MFLLFQNLRKYDFFNFYANLGVLHKNWKNRISWGFWIIKTSDSYFWAKNIPRQKFGAGQDKAGHQRGPKSKNFKVPKFWKKDLIGVNFMQKIDF